MLCLPFVPQSVRFSNSAGFGQIAAVILFFRALNLKLRAAAAAAAAAVDDG